MTKKKMNHAVLRSDSILWMNHAVSYSDSKVWLSDMLGLFLLILVLVLFVHVDSTSHVL